MRFELDPLPYELTALEPYMSARTLDFHYNKHHSSYLKKLADAIKGTSWAELDLEEIVRRADDPHVFQNAAQTWNHTFFWRCLSPPDSREVAPTGTLMTRIEQDFGRLEDFHESFAEAASGQFGSGWAWLVTDGDGGLKILSTSDADNPMRESLFPILTLDVWEHAYYLDYQNERPKFIEAFLDHLVNWQFAQRNFDAAHVSAGHKEQNSAASGR